MERWEFEGEHLSSLPLWKGVRGRGLDLCVEIDGSEGTLSKDSKQTARARALRRQFTGAERTLWAHLANRRLASAKFCRQQPIGPYIVDFVSFEHRLIVDVDGGHHDKEVVRAADDIRAAWLMDNGYELIRFWNNEVQGNLQGVLEKISDAFRQGNTLTPGRSP